MNSMTAFGRGEASNGLVTMVVELRSVNHRFRDLHLRVPREFMAVEPRLNTTLRDAFHRGRVECNLRIVGQEGPNTVTPDLRLASAYHHAMRRVARHLQQEESSVTLQMVFEQPGVLVVSEEDLDPARAWELLEPALQGAIAHMVEMRASEGRALQADIQGHLDAFKGDLGSLKALAGTMAGFLRKRLEDRLSALLSDRIDPDRLAQEAAILAEKADVSEELARLDSQVSHVGELLVSQEPVGRKLDFVVQEMNREVNTIGSKAVGEEASRLVVELKATLEKIREQAANVE